MSEKTPVSRADAVKQISLLYHKIFLDKLFAKSKKSSASTLLKYAGTWAGNDLEECLQEVVHSRGEAQF